MTPPPVEFAFLEDGGQTAEGTAAKLADFISAARTSLEIAIYDLQLQGASAEALLDAVRGVTARGVKVRVVFNWEPDKRPVNPLPPPSSVDWDLLKAMGVPFQPIKGIPDLMHHKYVVRDSAEVWTGSTNWTTDSWTREENVIVRVLSPELAKDFQEDFEYLWSAKEVAGSGKFSAPWITLPGFRLRPFFSPGRGQKMSHEIAHRISIASRRVRIASPVLTSGPVLGTLTELIKTPRCGISGVYDRTQMEEVKRQWSAQALSSWKLAAFEAVEASGLFASKVTTPYAPGSVHDFMHAKMTVADDSVFIGSYNLSHSGESNAENVLEIESAATADLCAAYIDRITARYRAPVPAPAPA
ncbi:MAG TPA: phospholipase D-like domain-containing protein [Candidatus Dormibacteraeota bacterium]|nr:phospholipase D-like domain-containing protein [Candidatus Dormibacteraeota bacterium]